MKASATALEMAFSKICSCKALGLTCLAATLAGTLPLRNPGTLILRANFARETCSAAANSLGSKETDNWTLVSDNFFTVVFIDTNYNRDAAISQIASRHRRCRSADP